MFYRQYIFLQSDMDSNNVLNKKNISIVLKKC